MLVIDVAVHARLLQSNESVGDNVANSDEIVLHATIVANANAP